MEITNLRKNSLFVGRAATAIYLILDSLMKNKEIILPSNICYAAVYPIIYSGNIPIFIDIDKKTGNAIYRKIIKKVNKNTGAIIFPYMYGNVSKDIIKLKKYCKKNKIILIEDCASAMGASVGKNIVGTIGDYSIFSTGHAKIVDVGNGGILLTDYNIDKIVEEYNKLRLYTNDIDEELNKFSIEYRELRNKGNNEKIKDFFSKDYKDLFLYKIDELTIDKMKNEVSNLENINTQRKNKYNLFMKNLKKSNKYKLLDYKKGSNPWRFTLLIKNEKDKKQLIEILLKKKLFVSDWYPCIGKIFSSNMYPNSDYMEKRILNFSLTDDDSNILKICETINDYFKGSKI